MRGRNVEVHETHIYRMACSGSNAPLVSSRAPSVGSPITPTTSCLQTELQCNPVYHPFTGFVQPKNLSNLIIEPPPPYHSTTGPVTASSSAHPSEPFSVLTSQQNTMLAASQMLNTNNRFSLRKHSQ